MRLLIAGLQVRVLLAELTKRKYIVKDVLPFVVSTKFGSVEATNTPYSLYILQSESAERYYVGISSDPQRRLGYHNTVETGFTARYRPWKIVYTRTFFSRKDAQRAEQTVKRWKSRVMIEKLISGGVSL